MPTAQDVRLTADIRLKGNLEEKLRAIGRIKASLKIGFLDGATYVDGTPVPYIAYLNENGTATMPARPFMKRTAEEQGEKWVNGIRKHVTDNVNQKSVNEAFNMAGQVAAGDIKRKIKDWPPGDPRMNRDETIARKARRSDGSIDPTTALIDSGTMIASVTWEVK